MKYAIAALFTACSWGAMAQPYPPCPPACGPGVDMPVPQGPYVPYYPPLRFPYRYGPGVDMPVESPAPRYRGDELLDEFHRFNREPLYPQQDRPRRRPRWDSLLTPEMERAFGKSDHEIIRDVLDFLSPGN
jgi:hypothetical protein